MIIGNRTSNIPSTTAKVSLVGALTHTVGYHSPSNLGPDVALYDGHDQILLEKVC